jgi:acyl-[acyl carrier protein]--UDP-N-acetylglucosamine O-acyltransferase
MRVAVGARVTGLPEQMAALDERLDDLKHRETGWAVEIGRSATVREIQVRMIARGLDEALLTVRTGLEDVVKELDPPLELAWARPRQVEM